MNKYNQLNAEILRQKAEELLKKKSIKDRGRLSEVETMKLIHELEVHQIELELQNYELRHAWAMAEVSSDKYAKLYNFSPTGYLSFSKQGKITELNLYAAQLLGKERLHLRGAQFGFFVSDETKPAFNQFLEDIFSSSANETCELTLLPKGNPTVFTYLTGIAATNGEDCLVSLIDITERKLKEAEIKTILQTTMDGFYRVGMDGRFIDTNDSYCRMIGYTRDEILKMGVKDVDVIDREEVIKSRIQRILKNGYERFETKHRCKDGRVIDIEVSVNLLVKENPELFCFMRDMTERKQTETALRDSEEKFKALFETANDGIFLLTTDGAIIAVNEAFARMHGFTVEDLLKKNIKDLDTPEANRLAPARMQRVMAGELMTFEVEHFSKNGETIPVEVSVNLVNIAGNKYLLGFHRDITKRKQVEKALNESETLHRSLFEISTQGIVYQNSDGYIVKANPAAQKILGLNLDQMQGKTSYDPLWRAIKEDGSHFLGEEHPAMVSLKTKKVIQNTVMGVFNPIDERVHWININASPLFKEGEDAPYMVYTVFEDFTERKLAEDEIKRKKEELQLTNAEKDKFFSILAHDLRSPFSGLLGLSQMIVKDLPSLSQDQIQKMTRSMRNSITNLYGLLENLLEWSRMQRGMIPFNPAPILLYPSISSEMQSAMELAKKKDIEICITIPEDLMVYADQYMLGGILRNLTSNAVKFTPKGGAIRVTAKPIPDGWVEISVKDTGIGMHKEMTDNLFRLDVNTNRKGTDKEPSTGLGLIICNEFIEKHGGKLLVESEEGKGSTFYFTVPKASDAEPKPISHDIPSDLKEHKQTKRLQVLIVEDDEATRMIFSISLQREGSMVLLAGTGSEAVEICRKNPDIDLVLMDINLPEMDGYEATRQIRMFNKNVVIIAQTAYSNEVLGYGQKITDAGCNDYILKPIDDNDLKELIRKHFPF